MEGKVGLKEGGRGEGVRKKGGGGGKEEGRKKGRREERGMGEEGEIKM